MSLTSFQYKLFFFVRRVFLFQDDIKIVRRLQSIEKYTTG